MISVTILAKNSERTLKATLDSLKDFPEVLVFDTGSTDSTKDIAKNYPNVKIIDFAFKGFGKTHMETLKFTTYPWILTLDSDEIVSKELSNEILNMPLNENCVYSVLRKNYFRGKHIKCCSGWHPDWITRLFNKNKTSFSEDAVHEKVLSHGLEKKKLKHCLHHTPYLTIADFLAKMQSYSTLFAEMNTAKKSSTFKALYHAFFAFFKSYILKRGFFGGSEGLIISLYNAHLTWYKYLKLAEKI